MLRHFEKKNKTENGRNVPIRPQNALSLYLLLLRVVLASLFNACIKNVIPNLPYPLVRKNKQAPDSPLPLTARSIFELNSFPESSVRVCRDTPRRVRFKRSERFSTVHFRLRESQLLGQRQIGIARSP